MGMGVMWKEYDDCGHWFKEPEGLDGFVAFLEEVAQRN